MSAPPVEDRGFHLFAYGTLRNADDASMQLMQGARRVTEATVAGTLYDIDGEFPALMLYGQTPIEGTVWHIPEAARLAALDEYEGVERGLYRRVAVEAAGVPCWVYVAGPALASRLTPERRIADGAWR
ncbi:MAG: gamma-glutamylcyclotransferase family protein [Longimicrobiales bacterium]